MLWALASCVIAVDQTVVIDEPVARIVVDVTAGDLVVIGRPGSSVVRIAGDFGGPGGGPIGHRVELGELKVTFDCEWCGGSLEIEAPPEVALDLRVGAGDLQVDEMTGELVAEVEAGSAAVNGHGAGPVTVDVNLGEIDAWFAAPPSRFEGHVKSGAIAAAVPGTVPYALTLDARDLEVSGIQEDDTAPNVIVLSADRIELEAR